MKKQAIPAILLCAALLLAGMTATAEDVDVVSMLLESKTTQAFTDEIVSDDNLNTILLAGVNAQSAMNSQPWHFSVVTAKEILTELGGATGMPPAGATGTAPETAPNTPPADAPEAMPAAPTGSGAKASIADAAAAIVISCSDTLKWNSFDAGAACDRMSVAARTLGYGTKIVAGPCDTINASADWKARMGIPDGMNALAVLLIGKVDESVDGASGSTARNPLEEVVTFVE